MRPSTFRSEWLSIGEHRVEVSSRDGAPDAYLRRVAMAAAWAVDAFFSDLGIDEHDVRLASVFADNRHSSYYTLRFGVLANSPDGMQAAEYAAATARRFVPGGVGFFVDVVAVDEVRRGDSYDHTEHLTLSAIEGRGMEVRLEIEA